MEMDECEKESRTMIMLFVFMAFWFAVLFGVAYGLVCCVVRKSNKNFKEQAVKLQFAHE